MLQKIRQLRKLLSHQKEMVLPMQDKPAYDTRGFTAPTHKGRAGKNKLYRVQGSSKLVKKWDLVGISWRKKHRITTNESTSLTRQYHKDRMRGNEPITNKLLKMIAIY